MPEKIKNPFPNKKGACFSLRSPGKDKKVITYNPNTLFIIDTKHEIKLKERTPYFPRRPCLQIEMTPEIYVNIKKELEINE